MNLDDAKVKMSFTEVVLLSWFAFGLIIAMWQGIAMGYARELFDPLMFFPAGLVTLVWFYQWLFGGYLPSVAGVVLALLLWGATLAAYFDVFF